MLFISRFIGYNKVGVVDTDDNIEEVWPVDDLIRFCRPVLDKISGVNRVKSAYQTRGWMYECVPFQPVSTMSLLQVKTGTLSNIDVLTYGDMITHIDIRSPECVSIRLSDFGSCCGDRLFYGCTEYQEHSLTVVLDDAITLSNLSLKILGFGWSHLNVGIKSVGVVFDMREVTREDTRRLVYASLYSDDKSYVVSSIIDNDEVRPRMYEWLREEPRDVIFK